MLLSARFLLCGTADFSLNSQRNEAQFISFCVCVFVQNFHLFARSATPDNRRICWKHYHYPGHHHPDFFKDAGHLQHSHPGDHHQHRTLSGRLSGKAGAPGTNSGPGTGQGHRTHHHDVMPCTADCHFAQEVISPLEKLTFLVFFSNSI